MNSLALYRSLSAIDARNITRDPLLRWMLVLTPGFGLLLRWIVPPATELLRARLGFDLTPYYVLLMGVLALAAAGMVGALMAFLLLDQRDDQTLSALLVTPLRLRDYVAYRMATLLVASVALAAITMRLAELTPTTPLQLGVTALVAAPVAPIYALFVGSVASNKVQGFALVKSLGIVLVPALAAYFVSEPWQLAFGVIPHYWPMKVFWLFDAGAGSAALKYAAAGLVWQGVLIVILLRRLDRVLRS